MPIAYLLKLNLCFEYHRKQEALQLGILPVKYFCIGLCMQRTSGKLLIYCSWVLG